MTSIEALIDRQLTRRQVLDRASKPRQPATMEKPALIRVITVSRETGSGGRTLAATIAKRLGFEFIDRQIVDRLVVDTGARERLIASLDERTRSGVTLWVEGILTGRYIDRSEYARALCHSITTLAEQGDAVILGRSANVILGPRGGLHVRIVAPPEIRLQNLVRHMGMTPKEALEHIQDCDEDRRKFSVEVLNANIENPNDYHMVINTGRVSLSLAEELIMRAWERYLHD
jgi:cytidylate kinase